tara:strand:+ start:403 stop:1158 length:756 start_codon:yes stop_codon:yes gene_type:complete
MTKNNNSLTVITVVKNDQKNIEKTIKSVISNNKGFKLEYIVIDGKSQDKTLSIIKKYKNKISKIISEKDNGIYDAMNKGIDISKNDIIVFCNSGDFFYKSSLRKVIQIFNSKNVDYVFGTVVRNYTKKKIIKFSLNPKRIFYNFDFATAHSTGFFLKREVYKKIGVYDLKFKCSSDFDLYFRMIKKGYIGSVTKKKDLIGNVASGGFSSKISFFEHLIEETKIRLKNKQNLLFIIIIFMNAIFKKLLKNLF